MEFLVPILTMGALGFLFSVGLVFAYRKFQVYIDPKIEKVSEALPQANCGACGFPGCGAMAEAMVSGRTTPESCPVAGEEIARRIAEIMGVTAGEVVKKIARVHCRGTWKASRARGVYQGLLNCTASHLIGGNKQCTFACLGLGDCVRACPFDAIAIGEDGIPVVIEEKCTGCGKCVEACPRDILEVRPAIENLLVFCRSLDRGPVARKACDNACIACGICSRACPEAVIMENNLAKIVDEKNIAPEKIPEIEKCPTGAIGRIHKET